MLLQSPKGIVELITAIISLITAAIGIFTALYTFLSNRKRKVTLPFDEHSMKIIKIVREPLDEKEWKEKERKSSSPASTIGSSFIIPLVSTTIIAIMSSILKYTEASTGITNLNNTASFVVIISSIYVFLLQILFRRKIGKNPVDGRFYIFKRVDFVVESDYTYLFNRCFEALKNMNADTIEVNQDKRTLETKLKFFFNFTIINIIVHINELNNNQYSIDIDFAKQPPQSAKRKSRTINSFIEQVIGKTA